MLYQNPNTHTGTGTATRTLTTTPTNTHCGNTNTYHSGQYVICKRSFGDDSRFLLHIKVTFARGRTDCSTCSHTGLKPSTSPLGTWRGLIMHISTLCSSWSRAIIVSRVRYYHALGIHICNAESSHSQLMSYNEGYDKGNILKISMEKMQWNKVVSNYTLGYVCW